MPWAIRAPTGAMRTEPVPGLNGRSLTIRAAGHRRLVGDQRHDLHARPGRRLRSLAPARQCRLGLGRRAALFHQERGSRRAGRCDARRAAANGGSRSCGSAGRCSTCSGRPPPSIGIPTTDDFNRGDNEGTGYFEVNQRRGRRWSAARGFLKPALERAEPDAVDRRPGAAACRRGRPRCRRRAAPSRARSRPCAPAAR